MVTATWTAFGRGDITTALANMDDNVTWLVPGNVPRVSGIKKGPDEVGKFMAGVKVVFPDGIKPEFRQVHCDGDSAIVELTNHGKAANGRNYDNEYCVVFEVENDKIRRIRTYLDTQKFVDTFVK